MRLNPRRARPALWLAGAGLAILSVVALSQLVPAVPGATTVATQGRPPTPQAAQVSGLEPSDAPAASDAQVRAQVREDLLASLPPSLRDAGQPASLQTDEDGELVLSPAIRNLFDFYLSALGEEDIGTISARIGLALENLPEPARGQAERLRDSYLEYQAASADLYTRNSARLDGSLAALRSLKSQQAQLRAAMFDPEAHDAFFGEEEQYDAHMLTRAEILSDDTLSGEEKARRLEAVHAALPPERRSQLERRAAVQAYIAAPSSARPDIPGLDSQAEARLDALDRSRADWQARLRAWREDLESQAHLYPDRTSPDYAAYFDQSLARHFSGPDLIRARHSVR